MGLLGQLNTGRNSVNSIFNETFWEKNPLTKPSNLSFWQQQSLEIILEEALSPPSTLVHCCNSLAVPALNPTACSFRPTIPPSRPAADQNVVPSYGHNSPHHNPAWMNPSWSFTVTNCLGASSNSWIIQPSGTGKNQTIYPIGTKNQKHIYPG